MHDAIDNLYATFAHCRIGDDFTGCDCCVGPEHWEYQLDDPIVAAFEDSIDTVLCSISNALSSVQRFLDAWIAKRTDNTKRHFAAFILNNDATLLKRGRLSNAFWDTTGQPHGEVINWLQSDVAYRFIDGPHDPVLVDDFAYAWPQLMAIRSSLAEAQR